jgi:hypothetical protein
MDGERQLPYQMVVSLAVREQMTVRKYLETSMFHLTSLQKDKL